MVPRDPKVPYLLQEPEVPHQKPFPLEPITLKSFVKNKFRTTAGGAKKREKASTVFHQTMSFLR